MQLLVGENKYIKAYSLTGNDIEWSSDCEDIATVTKYGIVYAHNIGKTTITGMVDDLSDSIEIEVPVSKLYGPDTTYLDFGDSNIEHETEFEELHIYGKPDEALRIGQTFPIGAIPYPINLYGDGTNGNIPNYYIEWESSNEEVAKVKYGVIEPLGIGKTIITAKIQGTEITDSLEIEVIKKPIIVENLMKVSSDYTYNGYPLIGGVGTDTTKAIYGAITEAVENGYNGVKFDKMELHTAPIKLIGMAIPSNFIVDFGFSSMYMEAWHDFVNGTLGDGTKTKAYRYFMGTDSENSIIRNLYFYGETYDGTHEASEYGEQTLFFNYDNARYFEIYNVFFESVIGFNVAVGYDLTIDNRDYHLGNPDGRSNGDIDVSNLQIGRLLEDGVVDTSQTGWCYTPNLIPFNNEYYSPYHYLGTNYLPVLGELFLTNRFYSIAFYDSDGNMIEWGEWRNCFGAYKTPENAVSYRATFPTNAIPSANSSIRGDNYVQRLMPANPSYCCAMYNCSCGENFSGILSIVGTTKNFRFFNNKVTKNGSVNAWQYDIEDSWYGAQSCVTKNNSLPLTTAISGVLNAIVDNDLNSLYLRRVDNTILVNNKSNYISYTEGINGITDGNANMVLNGSYSSYGNLNYL